MNAVRQTDPNQIVADIESLGVLVSKVNTHVFKFEVAMRESSLYVKRTNSGLYPVVIHPRWQNDLDKSPPAGIKVSPRREGLYKNSNLSNFPKPSPRVSPEGLAVAYDSVVGLQNLLRFIGREAAINDIDATESENLSLSGLSETEKTALIKARRGQGVYRTRLLAKWNGQCCVTGLDFPSLLRASHVKPWRLSSHEERLDGENGLLLIPNLDAAFDAGFITFSSGGGIMISPSLSSAQQAALGVNKLMQLTNVSDKLAEYLSYHLTNVFVI